MLQTLFFLALASVLGLVLWRLRPQKKPAVMYVSSRDDDVMLGGMAAPFQE